MTIVALRDFWNLQTEKPAHRRAGSLLIQLSTLNLQLHNRLHGLHHIRDRRDDGVFEWLAHWDRAVVVI